MLSLLPRTLSPKPSTLNAEPVTKNPKSSALLAQTLKKQLAVAAAARAAAAPTEGPAEEVPVEWSRMLSQEDFERIRWA
jgi:hypothetical protein